MEKYFRCLKDQVLEFQQQAKRKIPDVEKDFKIEVKQVLQELLLAKNGEQTQNLLIELKKFVYLDENNNLKIK